MNQVAPIFKNSELQKEFERDGFAKIKLLDREECRRLYNLYLGHQKEHDVIQSRYQATTHTNNPELILKINRQIKSVLLPKLGSHFQNYEPMMCTFITKQPGEGSETRLHQDPTFVDESKFVSANIWVALHDINHQNGNLFFVKGTHRFIPSLRVTPTCPTAYDKVKDLLESNLTEVPVKTGEAIVINHALMHGATPNLSDGLRIAAVMAIRSAGSEWIFHHLEPGAPYDKIERYRVDLDTFVNLKKDGKPQKAEFTGYIQWGFPQIDSEQFIRKMHRINESGISTRWLNRLSEIKEKLFP